MAAATNAVPSSSKLWAVRKCPRGWLYPSLDVHSFACFSFQGVGHPTKAETRPEAEEGHRRGH
jgi:hypothetical protein